MSCPDRLKLNKWQKLYLPNELKLILGPLSLEHGRRRIIVDDWNFFFGTMYIMPFTEIIAIFKMTLLVAVSVKAPLQVTELEKT